MSRISRASWRIVALLMVSSLVLTACGDDDEDTTTGAGGGGQASDTASIAFVGPLTGENANLGLNIRDAMKVAIEEENAAGGTRISLKEFDTQGDPAQASTLKDRFISDQSIIGIVGPTFSGETKALIPDLVNAGLVMISPSATNKDLPTVTANNNSFHRIIGDDALQAAGIAEFLSKERPRSVAYVHDNTEYGKPLAEDVERLATAKGH
ncbi:MAG: branched-chain amino acid ABC transporter substrate-binding protein [Actinobacteria bacterium]|nr:branched-chain amino acid ABC transporter substrate-binding protein [Actinomycetota bacterium]